MARKREIHPGFFKNEDIAELVPLARLFLIGMWNIADREGRLEDRPKKLRAEILPYDNCDGENLLAAIAEKGFIVRYQVDGNNYIQIVHWNKYQDIHPKETKSAIPPIPSVETEIIQEQPKVNLGTTSDESKKEPDILKNNSSQTEGDSFNPIPSCTSIPSLIDDDDNVRANDELYKYYQNNIGPVTSAIEHEAVYDLIHTYPAEWFKEAIKEAVFNKGLTFKYVSTILKNYKLHGFGWKPWQNKTTAKLSPKSRSPALEAVAEIIGGDGPV